MQGLSDAGRGMPSDQCACRTAGRPQAPADQQFAGRAPSKLVFEWCAHPRDALPVLEWEVQYSEDKAFASWTSYTFEASQNVVPPEERPAGGMYGVLLTGLFQADQTGSVFSFLRHALRPPELVQNDTRK